MRRILFISKWLSVAGTETFMMNVLRNIDKQKFHIDFLLFSDLVSDYSKEAEQLGAKIYRLPARNSGFNYYKSLVAFFKKNADRYDVIHFCGGNVSSIAPVYFAYIYRIPIRIIHSHSSNSNGLLNKVLHAINRNFIPFLGTHNFACSTLAAKHFFGNNVCTIIQNGINTDRYRFDEERRQIFRRQYDISPSTHVIGHIGRFDEVKNHVFLLDVFLEYIKVKNDSKLLLVGAGSLENKISQKVKDLGLEEKVLFLGTRSDIPDILCAMDCFVMPSLYEGLPFVLVEAQASGLPCVIADTINQDSKLSPYLTFRNLNDNLELWVGDIKNLIGANNRGDGPKYIKQQGFDIQSIVQYLDNIYSGQ